MALWLSLSAKKIQSGGHVLQDRTYRDAGPSQKEKAICSRVRSSLRMGEPVLCRGQATLPSEIVYDLHTQLGPEGKQNHQVLSVSPYSEPP